MMNMIIISAFLLHKVFTNKITVKRNVALDYIKRSMKIFLSVYSSVISLCDRIHMHIFSLIKCLQSHINIKYDFTESKTITQIVKNPRNRKIPNHPIRAKKALEQSLFGVFDGGCQLF